MPVAGSKVRSSKLNRGAAGGCINICPVSPTRVPVPNAGLTVIRTKLLSGCSATAYNVFGLGRLGGLKSAAWIKLNPVGPTRVSAASCSLMVNSLDWFKVFTELLNPNSVDLHVGVGTTT